VIDWRLRRCLANRLRAFFEQDSKAHTPPRQKSPHKGAFYVLAERVGLIRSQRELTLRAACGRLSRGCAALGSNPGGFVHAHLTGR
jgi:hypothetical protein